MPPTDSKKVALNAFSYYSGKALDELEIVQIIPVNRLDTALLHLYNFKEGFIIIAADNVAEPVLGFGLDSQIDLDDISPALHFLLAGYQEEILNAKRQNIRSSQEVRVKWSEYLSSNPSKTLCTPATWLIETKWDQYGRAASGSTVGYNYYCPTDAQGGKTIVGCGGVALAQILNFWSCNVHPQNTVKYPPPGLPEININLANQTYNWGNMLPNQANASNALLLYHCAAEIYGPFDLPLGATLEVK